MIADIFTIFCEVTLHDLPITCSLWNINTTSPSGQSASMPVSVLLRKAAIFEYLEPDIDIAVPRTFHACLHFAVENCVKFCMKDQSPINFGSVIL